MTVEKKKYEEFSKQVDENSERLLKEIESIHTSELLQSPIYITAKHIPIKQVEEETGYVFLYAEEDTDRAFYYNKGFKYTTHKVGTHVIINNTIKGIIAESSPGSIKVTVDKPELIYKGLSGSSVKVADSDISIAFVSAMDKDLTLLCYTYN